MQLHKTEFIKYITTKHKCTQVEAQKMLETVLSSLTDALAEGHEPSFVGFGTFFVRSRPDREGHNPKTKEKLLIKGSKIVTFKCGKSLKDACNK